LSASMYNLANDTPMSDGQEKRRDKHARKTLYRKRLERSARQEKIKEKPQKKDEKVRHKKRSTPDAEAQRRKNSQKRKKNKTERRHTDRQ
jgi:hypothetical protein